MAGRFRHLTNLEPSYSTSDDPLNRFYIPVLSLAKRVDRSAGYFTADGLALAARGLAGFIANGGTMRLLVGAQLRADDIEAVAKGADLTQVTSGRLVRLLSGPQDKIQLRRLEALAWMVSTGTLDIKVGLPRNRLTGLPLPAWQADGYFHLKNGIATDSQGDRIGWSGSNNETEAAWIDNFEQLSVSPSWAGTWPASQVVRLEDDFQRLWDNQNPDWITISIPEAARQRLLDYLPQEAPRGDPGELTGGERDSEAVIATWLRDLPHLLEVGEHLGRTTANIQPWPHQSRVADDIVAGFPDRFLLADEVGLGKTIEVGLALRDLLLAGVVERCLILAPKSVLPQWQGELWEKFHLRAPIYDGRGSAPAGPLLLVSSQLAKRKDRRTDFLAGPDWDLVVVDEAHHARRKGFNQPARRPNRLLELLEGAEGLEGLGAKTGGLLLLTATPMQVDPVEVWDLLIQLGLPGRWGASGGYFVRYFYALRTARHDWRAANWELVASMARDELHYGGPVWRQVAGPIEERIGWAAWDRLSGLLDRPSPGAAIRRIRNPRERAAFRAMVEHLTPLRRRMRRHTRKTLREYQQKGLLPARLAKRQPEPRWVKMAPDESALYDRVEEYISEFYRKYEGERKGLGFVMTVYRRRLTSSFHALERSLERRLRFLRSQGVEAWLADEDLEEEELQLDLDDVMEEGSASVRALQVDEIDYVEGFLEDVRSLGTDTKFDRLVKDLNLAMSQRDRVVIFTQYTDTMDYLRDRLLDVYGHRIACYSGRAGERWNGSEWEDAGKEEIKREFSSQQGNIRILLGTDAMAEGLNLQTCGVEINYDVPWNPMRLEQRIGRVDRIGQVFDTVWIWSYFLEGTIEAEVYRRLMERIDWFKGVVGPLQPILHQVGQTVGKLALMAAGEWKTQLEQEIGRIQSEIDQANSDGIDFDEHLVTPDVAVGPPPPVTPGELEDFFTGSSTLGDRFRPHGQIEGGYVLDGVTVTFRPETADQYPDSVRLMTFGDRVFVQLLNEFTQPSPKAFGIARVETVGRTPARVAWYRDRDEGLTTIESLADLRGSLGHQNQNPDLRSDAIGTFLSALENHQNREVEAVRQRQEERISALREKGRHILTRASYLWLAGQRYLLDGEPPPPMSSAVVTAMVSAHGYPFGPLAKLVGTDFHLSPTDPDWATVCNKPRTSLDGMMQTLRNQADSLVHALSDETSDTSERTPDPQVRAILL